MILCLVAPAEARVCAYDDVPAATLLFPFVVFDYNNPSSGANTILYITNTSATGQIVHVTLWTDTHMAILDFNVVLGGYDRQAISMRDILMNGHLPITGTSGGLIVTGGVAERGPVDGSPNLSAPDSSSSLGLRCPPESPAYPGQYSTPIPGSVLALFESWLTRSQVEVRLHGDCEGGTYVPSPLPTFDTRTTADPTWMYVTADVVWTCNYIFPDSGAATYWLDGPANNPGYDHNGAQRMTDNVLMGEILWYDLENRYSETSPAVHVEADRALGDVGGMSPVRNPTSGQFQSLFHHFSSPVGLSDLREPLPTGWAFGYMSEPAAQVETLIRAWKAPSASPDLEYIDGQSPMVALDCLAYTYYSWDEDENVVSGNPGGETNLLPLATQEVSAGEFAIPDAFGWMLFLWPPSNTTMEDNYQVWMGIKSTGFSQYTMANSAVVVANENCVQEETMTKASRVFSSGLSSGGGR